MSYLRGDFTDPKTFDDVRDRLAACDKERQLGGNALFYLAVSDRFFGPIVDALGKAGLLKEENGAWRRVVIEKPFGHDTQSAKALNARILKSLREEQIYRIDHFLGKETVQNIMALRFANGLFEPIWNRDRIDHIQITVAETVGVERRGNFYEATGALRDMVPNHLFQLVAMIAMEPPVSFDADDVRSKKAEVFKAMHPLTPDEAVRGQYGGGQIAGAKVQAYRLENRVDPKSNVETYVALRLMIDNWRWAGVPFYLRTGPPKSQSSSRVRLTPSFAIPLWTRWTAIGLFFRFSRTKASGCVSTPSGRERKWRWKAWRWTSNMPTTSSRRLPSATKRCSTTCSSATARCSSAPIRWRPPGPSSIPS
jgi:glucose-6-phosphate 1-dehydrogenase